MIQYKKCEAGDEKWVIEIVKQFRNQTISTQKAKDLVNNKNIWIYIAYDNDIVCDILYLMYWKEWIVIQIC